MHISKRSHSDLNSYNQESWKSKETKADQSYRKNSCRSSTSDLPCNVPKWSSMNSTVRNINSSQDDANWCSWDSRNPNSSSSWHVPSWISEICSKDANRSPTPKLASWNSNKSNLNSACDGTKQNAETNVKSRMKDTCKASISDWDSRNKKARNTDSSWDKCVSKTNSNNADKSFCLERVSSFSIVNRVNSSLNAAKCDSETVPKDAGKLSSSHLDACITKNTSSCNDSKWERKTITKNTPKWGIKKAPHSAMHNSHSDKHYDTDETMKETWNGSKFKDHRLNDEKPYSKSSQNDSKCDSWNSTKDSEAVKFSSWIGPPWNNRKDSNKNMSDHITKMEESADKLSLCCIKQRENETGNHNYLDKDKGKNLTQASSEAGAINNKQGTEDCGANIAWVIKEDRGIFMLKSAVANFTKDILRPYWKGRHLSKEEHNTIVKKVANKVVGSLKDNITPPYEKNVERYMSCNQKKLTNFVGAYLENVQKTRVSTLQR